MRPITHILIIPSLRMCGVVPSLAYIFLIARDFNEHCGNFIFSFNSYGEFILKFFQQQRSFPGLIWHGGHNYKISLFIYFGSCYVFRHYAIFMQVIRLCAELFKKKFQLC